MEEERARTKRGCCVERAGGARVRHAAVYFLVLSARGKMPMPMPMRHMMGVQACSPGWIMRVARGQASRREADQFEAAWLEAAWLDPPVHAHHSRAKGKLKGNHDAGDRAARSSP